MNKIDLADFKCLGCGACCRESGYVRLKKNEPDSIAVFLNMDINAFIEKHTILTKDRQALSLIEKKDGSCIFLGSKGCTINPVKPLQCQDFPHKWKFKRFHDICEWAKSKKMTLSLHENH